MNNGINSNDFPTEWGTFDATSLMILSLPPGCIAATFNISAAYYLTPIHPDQQQHLCVMWEGLIYIDQAVMFGLASSAGIFGCVADMLVAIYKAAGFHPLLKWVDDFFIVCLPNQSWSEQDFMDLTGAIGVPWSTKKTHLFSSLQRYIGFDWNLASCTVAIPPNKLSWVLDLLNCWLTPDSSFSSRKTAGLHGKLVHLSCIFPLICPFLRSISLFLLQFKSFCTKLHVPLPLAANLSWIHFLIHNLPNQMPLLSHQAVDLHWWGDASTSFGIGVVIADQWAIWKWSSGFCVGPNLDFNIGWAEAVVVKLGLRLAIHLNLFNLSDPSHSIFLVCSDNLGVVSVLNKGRSRSKETNRTLKHIFLLQACHHIHLQARHVLHFDYKSRHQTLWVTRVHQGSRVWIWIWVMPVGLILTDSNVESKVKV